MDGRQQGVGRLLPAVYDACSVSKYSALVRRKKGRMTQLFEQKNYLETAPSTMWLKLSALRDAPPTRTPLTFRSPMISPAFSGLTLPP